MAGKTDLRDAFIPATSGKLKKLEPPKKKVYETPKITYLRGEDKQRKIPPPSAQEILAAPRK